MGTEKKRLRSRKTNVSEESSDDDTETPNDKLEDSKEDVTGKRKTRSQSCNSESEGETTDDEKKSKPSESETSESDSEGKEVSCRKRKKRGRKSKQELLEQKEGNGSDKENETKLDQIETIEKEPINGKHPKTKRSKTSEPQIKRRTLRSSVCDPKKIEEEKSPDTELK